ncbi:hypothetical protein FIBSPDRAFT_875327 [Athelia psychrophila]|uniref:Uncharacterized protein n=1 Tax=Athelia psychrophila TaxID=1759441 RepID=A0A165WFC9_9AGAM|nr:hypothetical protein FIBSPDRAFT_875327 [Fibularhizoctonia sp. CBS 109695]
MHDLPTELLVKIFTYTLPHYPSFLDPREAPLLLDQVCGICRDRSRGTSVLLCSIKISGVEDNGSLLMSFLNG